MTDRDSDAWRRTEATTTKRLWAQGMQPMLATGQELAHFGDATLRTTMNQYGPSDRRRVVDIAPHGAVDHETTRVQSLPTDDAFDDFLATFEPELPTTR